MYGRNRVREGGGQCGKRGGKWEDKGRGDEEEKEDLPGSKPENTGGHGKQGLGVPGPYKVVGRMGWYAGVGGGAAMDGSSYKGG